MIAPLRASAAHSGVLTPLPDAFVSPSTANPVGLASNQYAQLAHGNAGPTAPRCRTGRCFSIVWAGPATRG